MEGDKFQVRNMLFLESDRQKRINDGEGSFIIKALFPHDKNEISRRIAYLQNGLPANSFSREGLYGFEREATIDQGIVESPEWWSKASECPDEDLLDRLFKEIYKWTDDFADRLKKNRLGKRSEGPQIS